MTTFLSVFGLGFAFVALPGAVTFLVVRRGLEQGFTSAMSIQLGALIGVAVWAIIGLVGASMLAQHDLVRGLLGFAGALLLGLLTWYALRDAYYGRTIEAKLPKVRGDFALGAALSLANPSALAFWLGVGSTAVPTGNFATDLLNLIVFLSAFIAGAFVWCLLFAGLITWGQRFVTPLFFRLVNLGCGLALGFFAVRMLWSSLGLLAG